jgi:hypothetical protein
MQTFKEVIKTAKERKIATSAISLCKLLGYNPQWYRTWEESPTGQKLQAQERLGEPLLDDELDNDVSLETPVLHAVKVKKHEY